MTVVIINNQKGLIHIKYRTKEYYLSLLVHQQYITALTSHPENLYQLTSEHSHFNSLTLLCFNEQFKARVSTFPSFGNTLCQKCNNILHDLCYEKVRSMNMTISLLGLAAFEFPLAKVSKIFFAKSFYPVHAAAASFWIIKIQSEVGGADKTFSIEPKTPPLCKQKQTFLSNVELFLMRCLLLREEKFTC